MIPFDNRTLLLVQDEDPSAKDEASSLRDAGFEVIIAHGGEEAVDVASGGRPVDLVLVDIGLGEGRDGIRTAETIFERYGVPVVFHEKRGGEALLFASLAMALRQRDSRADADRRLRALAEESRIFNLFLENSPVYVFFKDHNLRSLRLSRNYEKMLGKPIEKLIGKNMEELFPSELATKMVDDDRRILKEGKPVEFVEELGERSYLTLKFPILEEGKSPLLGGYTMDITERVEIEKKLEASVKEKQALLRELQHRVKNSFMMIAGIVSLEEDRAADDHLRSVLSDLESRVESLAQLYDLLFEAGETREVWLDQYLESIGTSLLGSYIGEGSGITMHRELTPLRIDVRRAVPIGLIVTELVTNALKYAFPGGAKGLIALRLAKREGWIEFDVEDDGVGMIPPKPSKTTGDTGLGLVLVDMLVQQLKGKLSRAGETGTSFKITIPENSGT